MRLRGAFAIGAVMSASVATPAAAQPSDVLVISATGTMAPGPGVNPSDQSLSAKADIIGSWNGATVRAQGCTVTASGRGSLLTGAGSGSISDCRGDQVLARFTYRRVGSVMTVATVITANGFSGTTEEICYLKFNPVTGETKIVCLTIIDPFRDRLA